MPKVKLSKTILLTAGAAVGALLFAPKSGKELRKDLKKEAERLGGEAKVYANNLKADLEESYQEAKHQAEFEKEVVARQEAELARTISEIEQELEDRDDTAVVGVNDDVGNVHGTALEPTHDEGSLEDVPENVLEDVDLGDVEGTSQEPVGDEVIPSSELDEALEDQGLENNSDFN